MTEKPESQKPSRGKVVVIEDSPPNRNILVHLLRKLGFEVLEFNDGEAAIDDLKKNEVNNLACVFTDVMMPKLNGVLVLKELRESEIYAKVPVVMVTSVSDKDIILQSKSLGVHGYLLKPITYEKLAKKLREMFPDERFDIQTLN